VAIVIDYLKLLHVLASHCHEHEWLSEAQLARLLGVDIVHVRAIIDGDLKLLQWSRPDADGDIRAGNYEVTTFMRTISTPAVGKTSPPMTEFVWYYQAMASKSEWISRHEDTESAKEACEQHARRAMGWINKKNAPEEM